LDLQLWHVINGAPWKGAALLKWAVQGSKSAAPAASSQPRHAPITVAHLTILRQGLDLNDTFDATVFGMDTIAFWCQCCLTKVYMNSSFDPLIHASRSSPQNSGTMISNICYSSFWDLSTKMNPSGEEIRWTDSGCPCSTEWAFRHHLKINSHVPQSAYLFTFETISGGCEPMCKKWFLDQCNEISSGAQLSPLSGHSF